MEALGPEVETWALPGFEPKRPAWKLQIELEMADMRRRLATSQELEQGQEEMRRADARMKREALERGEKALEDRTVGEGEIKVESQEETEKQTPAKTPGQGSANKQLLPPTDPPPDPPALGNGGSPSEMDEKKTAVDKGDGTMVSPGMPKVVDVATPGGQSAGSAG